MNPMQMLGGMKSPQQFIMNMLGNNVKNPMMQQLVNMAKDGKSKDVESFARNICQEKGIDFDKEFSTFMSNIKKS